jgi:hypothetical protein
MRRGDPGRARVPQRGVGRCVAREGRLVAGERAIYGTQGFGGVPDDEFRGNVPVGS